MCSATHAGFRVRRSYADVREEAGLRSATGPGKPYWKSPDGSTGLVEPCIGIGAGAGADTGTGGRVEVEIVVVVVLVAIDAGACDLRVWMSMAVAAAPAAAPPAATMASVNLDMLTRPYFSSSLSSMSYCPIPLVVILLYQNKVEVQLHHKSCAPRFPDLTLHVDHTAMPSI